MGIFLEIPDPGNMPARPWWFSTLSGSRVDKYHFDDNISVSLVVARRLSILVGCMSLGTTSVISDTRGS